MSEPIDTLTKLEAAAKAAPDDFGGPDERTWNYIALANPKLILRLIALARLAERARPKVILTDHDWAVDRGIRSHDPDHCWRCSWIDKFDAATRGRL